MAGAATDLMAEASRWTRRVVNALPCPDWVSLEPRSRPWILLDGAHSNTLENDLLQIRRGFEYRWVWRDTPREYRNPGYRHGPLLAPLDEALFNHAVDQWLRQQAGIIVVAPDDIALLVAHLQQLHQLVGTDGFPIRFSLNGARALEEVCEGLTAQSLSRLFGPIQRLIWYAGNEHQGEWLVADSPVQGQAAPPLDEPIVLTKADETDYEVECIVSRLGGTGKECGWSILMHEDAEVELEYLYFPDPERNPTLAIRQPCAPAPLAFTSGGWFKEPIDQSKLEPVRPPNEHKN